MKVSVSLHLKRKGNNSLEIRSGDAPGESPEIQPPKTKNSISHPAIPRVVRLLALAHHFDGLLARGIVRDYADIAGLAGVTRARVTQIMDLLLLAPEIQEALLMGDRGFGGDITGSERRFREITQIVLWEEQVRRF